MNSQYKLGQAIGQMYIAAQGISLTASDAACDAMEGCSYLMALGFNQVTIAAGYGRFLFNYVVPVEI